MLRERFQIQRSTPAETPGGTAAPPPPLALRTPPPMPVVLPPALALVKEQVHRQLVAEIDLDQLARLNPEQARTEVRGSITEILGTYPMQGTGDLRLALIEEILDEVLGLGPLEPLLRDDEVSEIMVNAPDQIWVERGGRIQRVAHQFRDEGHLLRVIERIVAPLGRRVDEASPMADARLLDGSRINVVVPPASPTGAKITLRKFARHRLRADDLVRFGTLSEASVTFLRACVAAELNVLVSGGTGTGKTTLLNVLSSFISEDERIVTIEDPLELQLQQPHVVALEARPPGIEGTRQITQRDLVRNALRMRPDRVIVGEVRGGEAFDMLQAMNTGHDGSISTVHANTPRDALSRVENMVLMAGLDLPDHAIREQIASAIQLIVQISRLPDGSRRVTHITEVAGMESQTITLQDLFTLETSGTDEEGRIIGALVPTGLQPQFTDRFQRTGVPFPAEVLRTDRW
ncbi:MAG: CpaF family protein [Chloroflexi bacterium]|nr:CpaF family protein [Chloroflexota bacterium]MDA1240881.1 CpaF family protein [Chloroflexota bacterium]